MASTVRSLSNHYETLRLTQAASGNEIVEAFAAQMRAARLRPDIPVSRLAELSVAYETLRDPARRRAYDASLGLDRAAKPDAPSPLAPAESRVAAFIATSLREPATPPQAQAVADPVPQPRAAAEPEVVAAKAAGLLIDRRGSTVAAGAVGLAVLALALSLPQQNPDRIAAATEPAQAVTVGLPPAAPVQDYVVPPQPSPAAADQHKPVAATAPEAEATLAATPEPEDTEQPPAPLPSVEAATVETPADPLAPSSDQASSTADAGPAPIAATDAKLPLPTATIARTIERIGYACGSVASATAVDGAAGAFKITCSSGDSYRAAPVGGRYHFRRWSRR